jgi:hypothetical protein
MLNAPITRVVDGWSVTIDGDEPRILDEELGARLAFSRVRDIRKLIERMIADGFLNDSDIRATVARVATGVASRSATVYRLSETGALLVIARSNTKIAHAITRQVVQVFIAVRRGQLAAPQPVPVLSTSPLVGDSRLHRAELAGWCVMAARNLGVRVQRIHGAVRRQFRVPGIYQLPLVFHPLACDLVESLAFGRLLLPNLASSPDLQAVADPPQGVLPFPTVRR